MSIKAYFTMSSYGSKPVRSSFEKACPLSYGFKDTSSS